MYLLHTGAKYLNNDEIVIIHNSNTTQTKLDKGVVLASYFLNCEFSNQNCSDLLSTILCEQLDRSEVFNVASHRVTHPSRDHDLVCIDTAMHAI